MDYEPLDLSAHCNAGASLLGEGVQAPVGLQVLRGLPFQVGPALGSAERCFVAFGPEAGPLVIPVGKQAHWLIFVHRLLESKVMEGGPLGVQVAQYAFHLAGGEVIRAPVRERFEISTIPPPTGSLPFLAFPDQQDATLPRHTGVWGEAGRRQTEVLPGSARWYFLWPWKNPHPERRLDRVEILPAGPAFLIGALTLSHLEEEPFNREATREVLITLPQEGDAKRPLNLEVEVDRGITTYPYALPLAPAAQFLEDRKGWGEAQNPHSSPAYAEVAANPSATVTVKQNGEVLGRANWGKLQEEGALQPTPRLQLRLRDQGRNWVHVRVVDEGTGKPVPCRVHFRSPEGIPYAPHGHHAHVNSNMGTWHLDVGGDLRLGQITYAYIDGTCQGWLPCGEVIADVARGYEYEPLRCRVELKPGQRELELRLRRWRDMNQERWFSGDSHVHFLSTQGSHAEARGEDLNVVNLLQSQWGSLFTNTEEFTGEPSVSPDGQSIVYITQENRQHYLGHLTLLGLKKPVMPWCADGPNEGELGGTLEATMSDWADQCRAQGGTVIIPHLPHPNGEPATLIATGRADAVEMLRHGVYQHQEYYRYLNSGYKLPLVGGTDKMTSDVPVGIYRTYVYIPPNEPFTYQSWCRNVAAGRTFHSGGPLLRFEVEGRRIGDTVQLPGNGGTVEVVAEAESILPIHTLEIVQEGRVVTSSTEEKGTRKLSLQARVKVEKHSWLAARCGGPGYSALPHHDGWGRGIMAHTSPVYLACGGEWWMFNLETAQYMLTLVDGCLSYIRHSSRQRPAPTTHHHGEADHLAYLERPFLEAQAAILRRMHQLGVPH
ncbi:MAG: CehA/McbA family metallohydrolase [Candidatus Handelsmanbacteria bacterium]|nr:CehA/McbA family metallohydrolase [Candidatus Handelsmanbacteria bacterium]